MHYTLIWNLMQILELLECCLWHTEVGFIYIYICVISYLHLLPLKYGQECTDKHLW